MKLCEATVVAAAYERTARNQHADALALVNRALQQNPRDATLIVARGTVLYEWGRVREARETLMRALSATDPDLPLKLGWCCAAMGLHSEALTWMAKAADRELDSTRAQFGLATTLLNAGRPDDAQKHLEKIVSRDPAHYQSLIQLGECKLGRNDLEAAERCFRSAIAAQPGNPIGWLNLSAVLDRRKLTGDAVDAVETAQRLEREAGIDIENFVNLALIRSDADRSDEARTILASNLPTRPSPYTHLAYGLLLLRPGVLREGREPYEFRLMGENRLADRPRYRKPAWNGQDLSGRTVVLRREQGFGDAIQFIRYAPLLKKLGATVWLQIWPAMRELAAGFAGVDRVFDDTETLPDFDYFIHLLSLPRLFGTDLGSVPAHVPYVRIDQDRLARWKRRMAVEPQLKVGLVWAGHASHLRDWERSIALRALMPLASAGGVRFFSLQKGSAAKEIASLPAFPIEDLSAELENFSDTAAVIQELDLVISVDTAVAHLAGALARPVSMLLPKPCDFRWLDQRLDSPWYPTMRLFRQTRRGDWDDVIRRTAAGLTEWAVGAAKNGRNTTPT